MAELANGTAIYVHAETKIGQLVNTCPELLRRYDFDAESNKWTFFFKDDVIGNEFVREFNHAINSLRPLIQVKSDSKIKDYPILLVSAFICYDELISGYRLAISDPTIS